MKNQYQILTSGKNWDQMVTREKLVSNFKRVNTWAQFFTHVKKWYLIITYLKNWYSIRCTNKTYKFARVFKIIDKMYVCSRHFIVNRKLVLLNNINNILVQMQDSFYHMTLIGTAVFQLMVFFSSGLHRVLISIATMPLNCFILEYTRFFL